MILKQSRSGQATLEYVLLLIAVVGFFVTLVKGLSGLELTKTFMNPMKTKFAAAYRYGNPKSIPVSGGTGLPAEGHPIFNSHIFYDPIISP